MSCIESGYACGAVLGVNLSSCAARARVWKGARGGVGSGPLLGGALPPRAVSAFGGLLPPALGHSAHELQVFLQVELGELERQPHLAPARAHEQRQLRAELAVVPPD